MLLIPTVGTIALLANVNACYPQRLRGAALATNAGVGNLGVAVIQVVGLLVLASAGHEAPYWAEGQGHGCARPRVIRDTVPGNASAIAW